MYHVSSPMFRMIFSWKLEDPVAGRLRFASNFFIVATCRGFTTHPSLDDAAIPRSP